MKATQPHRNVALTVNDVYPYDADLLMGPFRHSCRASSFCAAPQLLAFGHPINTFCCVVLPAPSEDIFGKEGGAGNTVVWCGQRLVRLLPTRERRQLVEGIDYVRKLMGKTLPMSETCANAFTHLF